MSRRLLPAVEPGAPLTLHGLAVEDGAIVLAPLPGLAVPFDADDGAAPLAGPAGAAVDRAGTVYISDPDHDRILALGVCETDPIPLGCVRAGEGPGCVRAPGGLAVDARGALYVADRGNHRVQAIDPRSGTVLAVLGQHPDATLRDPEDVALDAAGRLYVADRGNARVVRFALPARALDGRFSATLESQPVVPHDPLYVAVAVLAGTERLVVLDRVGGLLLYGLDGVQDEALSTALSRALAASLAGGDGATSGLAARDGRILVGDPTGRRVLAFDEDGRFAGAVPSFRGASTALALDARGRLVVATRSGTVRLDAAGRSQAGSFVLGPLDRDGEAGWRRVIAQCDPLPDRAHVRLYTFTADSPDAAPPPFEGWSVAPADQLDALVPAAAARYLWVGGALSGTGTATPSVRALQLTGDDEGWKQWLPAVYSREAADGALDGLLALLEGGLDEQEAAIAGLAARFDADAAPDDDRTGRWLDWLAGWQSLELDAQWSESERRRAVRGAFAAHGRRGTPRGLRDKVRDALGVDVWIDEPAVTAELWQLGVPDSALGADTMLASAESGGAVLGRTATLGRSALIDAGQEGAPLFADLAHRFCVSVHAGDLAGARSALVALVDRERPAHTAWALRVIEPRARVGLQARVGVDAVVARRADPLALGSGHALGEAALAANPAGSRIGEHARLGIDATVS
jgi:phage tail-like protein